MLPPEEVEEQRKLLATYRRTLAIYLQQQATIGKAFSPPILIHGIQEARGNIKRIKAALRTYGIEIPDDLDDEEFEQPVIVVRPAAQRARSVAPLALLGATLLIIAGVAAFIMFRPFTATFEQIQVPSAATAPAARPPPDNGSTAGTPISAGDNDTVLISYDFEDAAAAGWSGTPEHWQVVEADGASVYQGQAPADNFTAASPTQTNSFLSLRDYALETRIRIVEPGPQDDDFADTWFTLRAQQSAGENCEAYVFYLSAGENRQASIVRNGGANCPWTVIAGRNISLESGRWYTVRLEVVGTSQVFLIDGQRMLQAADLQLDQGFFYITLGPSTVVQFDDIQIHNLAP